MVTSFIDTHCHIHEIADNLTPTHDKWFSDGHKRTVAGVKRAANEAGVTKLILIGTSLPDSELAIRVAEQLDDTFVSIGIHPHEASKHMASDIQARFAALAGHPKVVAVGECGLDYYYNYSPRREQEALLRFQLRLANEHGLPLSFHVRDAFDDFWTLFDEFEGVRGVLHSFTDSQANLEAALRRGLYIGVNGIATFAKDEERKSVYRAIPLESLLLETDSPYLTPVPYRGKVCEPKHVIETAEYLSNLRGDSINLLARYTTDNAQKLFKLK